MSNINVPREGLSGNLTLNVVNGRVDIDVVREDGTIGPILLSVGRCKSPTGLQRDGFMLLNVFDDITIDAEMIFSRSQREFHETHVELMEMIGEILEIDNLVTRSDTRLALTNVDPGDIHDIGVDNIINSPYMVEAVIKVRSFDLSTCKLRYERHAANISPYPHDDEDDAIDQFVDGNDGIEELWCGVDIPFTPM